MALRHPWFSQPLKRKHPDDPLSDHEGSSGGGLGIVGAVYGGLGTNACGVGQATPAPPNQGSNSNGRATKRFRNLESPNLERGFAGLSIQTTSAVASPIDQRHPDAQVGGDGVWNDVVGNAGQCSSVVCPDGSTLPLLRSCSVDEPPSPEVDDIQMSIPTWYEPEKDRIVITSLDDDEYDGDDEGQQHPRTAANPTAQESEFTISPAFLNAINKKLTQAVDPPTPQTDASSSRALVLFRPLPTIALPPAEDDLRDLSDHEGGMPDSSLLEPPLPSPPLVSSSPFRVQVPEQPSFVYNDDDMEIEML